MPKPKKLPSGNWWVRGNYVDPVTGKVSRPSFTAPTKAEAMRMEAEWEANKRASSNPLSMTVGDCLDRYIASKRGSVSPSTLRGYEWMKEHRYAQIRGMRLSCVTDETLQGYVSALAASVSPKSVRNAYGLLAAAMGMFSGRCYHVKLPAKRAADRHIPTDADIKRLMNEASPKMRLVIALSAFGTLRRGEICALRHMDVDRENGCVHVRADMVLDPDGKWVVRECAKTDSSTRMVPLPPEVIAMIGEGEPNDLIVGINPGTVGKNFWKLRNKLGLRCRFHDLRHYAASIMHAIGIPDQYIMEIGGWSTDSVLKSVYRNTLSDQSEKFRRQAAEHFRGMM